MCGVILRLGLYQSRGSLQTRRRIYAIFRRVLLWSSTSLIVPGIWVCPPGNLSAIPASAPTTTGITMILTFHSCSSSIFNYWYLLVFFILYVLDALISWHYYVNYEAGLFLVVDQHNVRPFVKQMLIGLDRKISKDRGVIVPDYFFWFYPPVLTVLKVVLSTYGPIYYWGHIVVSLSVLGPCELSAVTDDI